MSHNSLQHFNVSSESEKYLRLNFVKQYYTV